MFRFKSENNFEFRIHWQKPYIIRIRESARNVHTSRSKRSGDTFEIWSCTDVNADGVPMLQHYQDTYISLNTYITHKIGCKKVTTHLSTIFHYLQIEPVLKVTLIILIAHDY